MNYTVEQMHEIRNELISKGFSIIRCSEFSGIISAVRTMKNSAKVYVTIYNPESISIDWSFRHYDKHSLTEMNQVIENLALILD